MNEPLLKAMYKPLKQWGNELQYIKLSPEETFKYIVKFLEDFRRSRDKVFDFSAVWDVVYADFDDENIEHREEVVFATNIVISVLYVYLSKYPDSPPDFLYNLIQQLIRNTTKQEVTRIIKEILGNITLFGNDKITKAVCEYIDNKRELSGEINKLVESTYEPNLDDDDNDEQISTRQLVLLFQHLLDISLDPTFVNQTELANFLSLISRKSPNAIRQKIIEINRETDSRQTLKDVEFLVKQIQLFNNRIASDLLKNYEI